MNILIFSWRGPKHPNAGGAEISTHEHAKSWVNAGHDVTLFTSAFVGYKKQEIIDGIKIERRGGQILGVQWEALKWYIFGKHPKFDLVVDQFHGIPFFTPLYIKAKKLGFIHEVTKEVWRLNPWPWPFNWIVAYIGEICEPLVFKFLYRKIPFMTVSESTKDDLIKWGILDSHITVIHNGVKVSKPLTLLPKERKRTGIYLGAISKDKGIEDAINIFAQILARENNWQFWVVGKAEVNYFNFLKKQIKKLGISKNVVFFGFVSEKSKYKLLSRAHFLINPSMREGWGLVVIEAAAAGTPTVGYDVPGLRDSIINNRTGILCTPTPEACSEAILKLMVDPNKYKILRRNCLKWGKKFKWENTNKQSLKLIQSLIKNC